MEELTSYINNFDELVKYNSRLIDWIGDCPNVEVKVLSDNPFWRTIETCGEYRCQQSLVTQRVRVINADGIRVANGSKPAMLEKMKRLSNAEFLLPGDVIGISRAGLYEHYAVYIGDGKVIHYCGEGNDFGGRITIHEADLCEFVKEGEKFFVVWFDEGRAIKLQNKTNFLFTSNNEVYEPMSQENRMVFSAEETIQRAKSRIGEENYSLIHNNCEHFAMWCKTGVSESLQVKNIARFVLTSGVVGYAINAEAESLLA